jgi:CheY-like chemotaxis protein/HPt (histidine-containing phosphotransfer) domain-containing protein
MVYLLMTRSIRSSTIATASIAMSCTAPNPVRNPQFNGLRVLLAEDNPINQEVAVELLRASGLTVDVASNGVQAVEMAQRERYDLIFMDVQMPLMDGFEATRLIRQIPGREHTPIVAMTANAFEEDRRLCLAAGMNDHLGKPVELRVLRAALQRWLPDRASAGPRTSGHSTTSAQQRRAHLEAIAGLQIKTGLGYVQNRLDRYELLLQKFIGTAVNDLARLRAALATDDRPAMSGAAHSLRGAAAVVGATAVESAALAIENVIRERKNQEELRLAIEQLESTHSALAAAVGTLQATTPAAH